MSDRLALSAHRVGLRSQMPVRVDLHLDAAIAEDAFGDDGDHVDALHLRGDDERRGLVVGISRAGADGGDEIVRAAHDAAIPLAIAIEEGNDRIAARHGAIEHNMRIDAHQLSVVIAVAIARTGPARLDVAQDGQASHRMASSSVTFFFRAGCQNCGADAVGRGRHAMDANADRVLDRVENRRRGRNHRLLADSLGAKRADRRGIFDQDRLDRRHVAGGRNQIVMQILALAGEEFFHQRHPQALRGAAFDLAFDQRWIDGAADVVRRGDLQYPHRAEFGIDRDLGQVRAKSKDRIGSALAVLIQRTGGRIESGLAGENVAILDPAASRAD